MKQSGWFSKFAKAISFGAGQPWAFGMAALVILAWGLTGPIFHFSDTWQLVINTSTTIVTFLMVFVIQNTQNRDTQALQLKLDELIRATQNAHTALMDIEELEDHELAHIKTAYRDLARDGRKKLMEGGKDTGVPTILMETFGEKPSGGSGNSL